MKLKIITKQYIMLLTIGSLFLFCFLFYTLQEIKLERLYNSQSQAAITQVINTTKLNSTAQFIRYYDEVLTQSARNYAYTGDVKWKERYDENVPKLDEMINFAVQNDAADKQLFNSVDSANQALIKMEQDSAALVAKGNKTQAIQVLESDEYAKQKQIYSDALIKYTEKAGHNYDQANVASTQKLQEISDQMRATVIQSMTFTTIIILVVIAVLTTIGILLTKIVTRPVEQLRDATMQVAKGNLKPEIHIRNKDEIGDLANSFSSMALAIKKSRAEVDQKVKEQTGEILEKQQFADDQRKAILNVLEDVELEKTLTSQERDKIDAILHSIGDAVFVVDKNLKIVLVNGVTSKISGYSQEELSGKVYSDILQFVFENTNDKVNDKFVKDAISTGKVQEMSNHTMLIQKDGGRIAVADSAAPLKDKDGKITGCVVVFRDVTRERRIDQAKTEFVSLASHQLRTPLSAVNWYAEMLLAGDVGKLTAEQKKYLDEIYKGNQRMVNLVNALLDVSRIELGTFAVDPKKIKITDSVHDIVKEVSHDADKKKITIEESFQENLPEILADPKLIQIIIQNLLSNAVKYTPEKGSVKLKIEKKDPDMIISVKDTGYGIPQSQKDQIFTKLFRADNVREKDTEGTGLGLYIVKSIVEHSGGKVWFDSVLNKGTTFYVTIPLTGMVKKEGTKALEDIK